MKCPTMREVFVNARAAHADKTFLVYEGERASVDAFARATLTLAHHWQAWRRCRLSTAVS